MRIRHIKKEVFVCEGCGARNRLTSAERHWCEDCNLGAPVEMNPVRFRGFTEVSLTRIDTLLPRVQRSH